MMKPPAATQLENITEEMAALAPTMGDWLDARSRYAAVGLAESRARDIDRAVADWTWHASPELALISASDALSRLLALTPAALAGRSFNALGRFQPASDGSMPIQIALLHGTAFDGQLFELVDCAGRLRRFLLSATPEQRDGVLAGYRGMACEVHAVADEQASKASFLAAMSHELRTPLNAIIGFAEAMQLQIFGPLRLQYVDYAQDIARAGRHLLTMIDDVLDVSNVEDHDVTIDMADVDLGELVERAQAMIALRADAKRQKLTAIADEAPLIVRGDGRRILQILLNLLNNAVKFTPEGGTITLTYGKQGASAHVAVRDTGPGIAQVDHQRVFEKFEQLADNVYAGKPEGTGLGLHISRRLARRMGGDVLLDSRRGQGACFTLSLPLAGQGGMQ